MQSPAVGFAGICLGIEVPIPELSTSWCSPVECRIIAEDVPDELVDWIHDWVDGLGVSLSVGRIDGGYVLRFPDSATFRFEPEASTLRCPIPFDDGRRHQLLDQVLPRVLEYFGHLMIHGSAVTVAGRTVMFIGDSGHGKSTLAAHFRSSGGRLLSDDGLRLMVGADRVTCIPTYPSLRLWADSVDAVAPGTESDPMGVGSAKRRLRLGQSAPSEGAELSAIVALDPFRPRETATATLGDLCPADATTRLLAQCFRLDPTDRAGTARAFEQCADVVERVPVVELGYPMDFARLGEVHDRVVQWLTELPASG